MDIRELIKQLERLADKYGDDQRVIVISEETPTTYRSCSNYDIEECAPGEVAIVCNFLR